MNNQKGSSKVIALIALALGMLLFSGVYFFTQLAKRSNESYAISSLRQLHGAQAAYRDRAFASKDKFAPDFVTLQQKGMIDRFLASGKHNDYNFVMKVAEPKPNEPARFDIMASPMRIGTFGDGDRYFYTNELFVIFESKKPIIVPTGSSRVPSDATPLSYDE